MALEIIKGFPAIIALIQRLAGSRTKLADQFCMCGMTERAFDSKIFKIIFVKRFCRRWRYAISF